jgi:hypothetical protein
MPLSLWISPYGSATPGVQETRLYLCYVCVTAVIYDVNTRFPSNTVSNTSHGIINKCKFKGKVVSVLN